MTKPALNHAPQVDRLNEIISRSDLRVYKLIKPYVRSWVLRKRLREAVQAARFANTSQGVRSIKDPLTGTDAVKQGQTFRGVLNELKDTEQVLTRFFLFLSLGGRERLFSPSM